MTYDADGELLTESRYSDLAGTELVVKSNYTYDSDGEITNLMDQNGGGTIVANFTYTYDQDNRVTTEVNMGMTTTYTYDADSQLTSDVSPLATIDYTYDADGQSDQRQQRDRAGKPTAFRQRLDLHVRR